MRSAEERVAKGAALLDRYVPDWRDLIDTDDLDIASGTYCVLGQVYRQQYRRSESGLANAFCFGLLELAAIAGFEAHSDDHYVATDEPWDVEHGFMEAEYDSDEWPDGYDDNEALTEAWRRLLAGGA